MDNTAPFGSFRAPSRLRTAILAIFIAFLLTSTASAVIYMKVQDINGDVNAAGYSGWIEVTSLQWSLSRSISAPAGGAADRESSPPSFSEVATTKLADITTAALFKEAAIGVAKTVEFHFLQTDRDKLFAYQKIKLEGVLISGFSQSSGGDRPSESLSLNYTKITFTYTPIDDTGKPGTDVKFTFDLATGRGT